ncbi:PREDICTED: interleukin-17 receptor E [Cyprinodon variegatus]|uniref:interleukin-17 receptor E n=1 Tax=Cyprinodon variegatus TaxID=28743 RepID=UPI0007425BC4|nr:PREDICTED: interleukin-17 receptor E [Cyprinodon variegatus]
MFFSAVLTLLVAACSLQVRCFPRCQEGDLTDVAEGRCPISLTSSPLIREDRGYSEKITVQVWKNTKDFHQLEIHRGHTPPKLIRKCKQKTKMEFSINCCSHPRISSLHKLELKFEADATRNVSVSFISKSLNCSVSYLVPDPWPNFTLSVNKSSKIISVDVDSGEVVKVRLCYEKHGHCHGGNPQAINRSAVLSIPYLLPCVCVEVYYNYIDAARHKKCPFENQSLIDTKDILQSSTVQVFTSYLSWSSVCPAQALDVSAALCWMIHNLTCIPLPNSTLEREYGPTLRFKTSTVDKHPQICVQFYIQNNHNISCLSLEDKPSWETHVTAGIQSVRVHIISTVPARFSAQLCVLTESGCLPRGPLHIATMPTDQRIVVPIQDITEKPCIQVWQSDPALIGRRILCPDFTRKRWGVCAGGVLVFAVTGTLLGFLLHRALKSGMAGLLTIQRPLLMVCSSSQSAHISAACALASILQEELGASVDTTLWAQSSKTKAWNGASVADLGPLPWLYGQWENILEEEGKILIVWSSEAKRMYQRLRTKMDNSLRPEKIRTLMPDYLKPNGWKLGKNKKNKYLEDKGVESLEYDDSEKEPSAVIEPVFVGALAALEGALQEGKCKDVTIVFFQGLCRSKDIPQAFRGVPHYCLPQEFSGFIQEMTEMRGRTNSRESRWRCWPRLLSKVLSVWLARQLTQRLQTVLPDKRTESVSSTKTSGQSDCK